MASARGTVVVCSLHSRVPARGVLGRPTGCALPSSPMTAVSSEKRQALALDAIQRALGTEAGEDSVDVFIEHHLAELPASYWFGPA